MRVHDAIITLRAPAELRARLDVLARAENRPLGELTRDALRQYVERTETPKRSPRRKSRR
jgi:predicted transcriptional regulator